VDIQTFEIVELLAWVQVELDARKPDMAAIRKALARAHEVALKCDSKHYTTNKTHARMLKVWGAE
jgi:hypothetical protein